MLYGDTACLECHGEAVGGGGWSHYCHGRLAIAPVQSLHKVGLLGFRRQTRRRTAALNVDHDKRKFCHHGKTYAFTLERQTRTRCGRHCKIAGEGGAYRRAYACNLILHLAGLHTKILALGKFVEYVCGGSDGI